MYWTLAFTPQTTCIIEREHLLAAGIINTVTDLLVVLLPITTILGVKIPFRETVIIIFLFSAGFMATAAGAVRTYFVYFLTAFSNDKTWDISLTWYAAEIELYVGIVSIQTRMQVLRLMYISDVRLSSSHQEVL